MIFKMNKSRLSRKIAATFMMWAVFPIGAFAAESNETNEDATEYVNMEDMLITAERIPTNKWDTPANIAIITAKEIEDNHYQDLAEALSYVNGVYVPDSLLSRNIILNGTNRVILLVDGIRLNSPQTYTLSSLQYDFAETRGDILPIPSMNMIERIEIIKGGNSALYGSDAVGGVVNIITKKARRNETTIDINKSFGQSHHLGTEISNQGVNGNFGYFLSGSFREKNGNSAVDDTYHSKGLSIRMDYRFDNSSSLTLQGMHNNLHKGFSDDNLYNNIAVTYSFKEGTSTPGWFRYHNSYNSFTYHRDLNMQGIEYQNGWQLNKNHKLIIGAEWQKYKVYSPAFNYNGGMYLGAIYLQDTINVGNKWQIVPGVRLDYQEIAGSHWSPKIAANYRPDDKTKFYSSWGRVHNSPSAVHLFANGYVTLFSGTRLFVKPNKNIGHESGQAFTIGFEHAFDEKTNLSMNYFNSYLDNVIEDKLVHEGEELGYNFVNAFPRKQHGFEIAFNQKLSDKWSYGIGYTHSAAGYRTLSGIEYNSEYPMPTDSLIIGLKYHTGPWKVNLTNTTYFFYKYTYMTHRNETKREMCNWLDLSASYDLDDQLTIYTKIKNLGNRKYDEDTNFYEYRRPGRYYMLGATYKF